MDLDPHGLPHPIGTLLVANRGEVAGRIFTTAREMSMTCVAVFSDADRDALHVALADVAVHLPGTSAADTYLNIPALLAAAHRTGADAIHPGYGFLAENPDFAQAVVDAGLIWVGPPPDAIRAMALKVRAKEIAAAAGLPLLPGAELTGADAAQWTTAAAGVGYPLLVKASAGGGGKGMRIVTEPDALADAVTAARREAAAAFGDGTVFLERYLPRARHVEVQVFSDGFGNHLHLFDRECSIQRRHQKIIEEAPSPGATDLTRARMYPAAVTLAERIGYVGAGTVEFLVTGDGDAQEFFFLEMNTRLQVEHRVTEAITGTDLVQWQLLVAQGKQFNVEQSDLEIDGHAIEVRLYAEDPANGYLPSAGTLEVFELPETFGVTVDTGYSAEDTVPPHYDPLLAKITGQGSDREAATRELIAVLRETVIAGVATNRDLLVNILASFPFFAGDTTTAFLDEHPDLARPGRAPQPPTEVLIAAAFRHLDSRPRGSEWAGNPFAGSLTRDPVAPRWRNVLGTPGFVGLQPAGGDVVWLRYQSADRRRWTVSLGTGAGPYDEPVTDVGVVRVTIVEVGAGDAMGDYVLVELDGLITRLAATVDPLGRVDVRSPGGHHTFSIVRPGARQDAADDTGGPVAPVPGTIAAVLVTAGEQVAAGQALVVLEAMKMEHRITAPVDATVAEVLVSTGQAVDAHQLVVRFAAEGDHA